MRELSQTVYIYNMPLSTHGRRTEGRLLGVLAVGHHQVEEGWHSIKPRLASRCSILELLRLASHAGKLRLGASPHVLSADCIKALMKAGGDV